MEAPNRARFPKLPHPVRGSNMASHTLVHVELDQSSIIWRNAEVEQERRVAIHDLVETGVFAPVRAIEHGHDGPYRLALSVTEGRLVFDIADEAQAPLETVILALGRFQRPIREYWAICESYFQAMRTSGPQQIETVDMARRGLHNDASEMLKERLAGKIDVDFETARRLFTLICVLHIRS
jgi:uncharacterized protein (UPF0262 family)